MPDAVLDGACDAAVVRLLYALAIVVSSTLTSAAQPATRATSGAAPSNTAPSHEPECAVRPYLEPSLFLTVLPIVHAPSGVYHPKLWGMPLLRVVGGVRLPSRCAPADLEFRFGVTAYVSALRRYGTGEAGYEDFDRGYGAELEVSAPKDSMRLGGRAGIETAEGDSLTFTIGARLRFERAAWLGVDAFHITRPSGAHPCSESTLLPCSASTSGLMAGFGLTGRAGIVGSALAVLGYLVYSSIDKGGN